MNRNSVKFFLVCLLATLAVCANASVVNKAKGGKRIVGGMLTTIDRVPYLVQLRAWGQFFCGGTLVSPTHVVSAAHCLKATGPENIMIVGGATTIADAGVQRRIVATYVHPKYDIKLSGSTHDIVVFKLESPMVGPNIQVMPLCTRVVPPKELIQVSGWGHTSENSKQVSHQVRTVRVPTFSQEECKQRYGSSRISESMFCASNLGSQDACQGDSGGPAIYRAELCGVVSWGSGCAGEHFPGVYTDVLLLRPWIDEMMSK